MAESSLAGNEFEWHKEASSLEELKDGLPFICKYEGQLQEGTKLYSKQPVILFKLYQKKKAYVRTIFRDPSGPYYEVGQTLQIPEDFEGWFELVPPDFGRVKFYDTIEGIAKSMPNKFFTRTNVTGIREAKDENGEQLYFQRTVSAGKVLKFISTFNAKWQTSAETGIRKKKRKQWTTKEVKYLKCVDTDQQEILIPLSTKGKFHPIYQTGNSDTSCVFRIKDILKDFTLPVKVRLIYGKPPAMPCIFTGMLVVKNSRTEEVVVGSTITFKRHALFELPVSHQVKIYTLKSNDELKEKKSYKEANQLCHTYSDSYSSLIKLSPDLDTRQEMIQHIPTVQQNGSLKTLDLITNISLTDDDPRATFMETSSECDSHNVAEQFLTKGTLIELTELSSRTSMQC